MHRYPQWAREPESIYDLLPDRRVVVSGASCLDAELGQHELARRVLSVRLPDLSLREHRELEFSVRVDATILARFNAHLERGAYPYALGARTPDLHAQAMSALQAVLYQDIPTTFGTAVSAAATLQRLLALITTSEPFMPNVESMARALGIVKTTAYAYLEQFERSSVLTFLPQARSGSAAVRKPARIYLATPTRYVAIAGVHLLEDVVLCQDVVSEEAARLAYAGHGAHPSERLGLGFGAAPRVLDGIPDTVQDAPQVVAEAFVVVAGAAIAAARDPPVRTAVVAAPDDAPLRDGAGAYADGEARWHEWDGSSGVLGCRRGSSIPARSHWSRVGRGRLRL